MYDRELVTEMLRQIREAALRIERRFEDIREPDDFLASDEGLDRLDAIAMMLIAIGENLKKIDNITEKTLLPQYSDFDWKGAKNVRDFISHQYFEVDAEIVFNICQQHIPTLIVAVNQLLQVVRSSSE